MKRSMVTHVAAQLGVDNLCRRHAAGRRACVLRRQHRGSCLPAVEASEMAA